MLIKLTRLCFYFSEIALWNQNYTFQRIFEFNEDSSLHESDIFHWSHSVLFMVSCVTRGSYRGFSRNCITINTLVLTKTDSDSVCRSQRSLTNIDGSMPHIGWHSIEIILTETIISETEDMQPIMMQSGATEMFSFLNQHNWQLDSYKQTQNLWSWQRRLREDY